MAQVSLPYTLTAGTPENVNNLVANLNALVAGVNTIDTAQLASGAVTTAKLGDGQVTSAKLAASLPKGLVGTTTYGQTAFNYNSYADVGSTIDCGTVAANRKYLILFNAHAYSAGAGGTIIYGLKIVAGGSTTNVNAVSMVNIGADGRAVSAFQYLHTTAAGTLTITLRGKKADNVTIELESSVVADNNRLTVLDVGGS